MKASVAVTTYNRLEMLKRTLASIERAGHPYTLHVLDGGSRDGSREYVKALDGGHLLPIGCTVGYSVNAAMQAAQADNPDLTFITADDMEYHDGWLAKLVAFWRAAPPEIVIACANWEPMYPWNSITERHTIAGMPVLIRASVPGSSWSFRTSDTALVSVDPLKGAPVAPGEDMEVCQRLVASGRKLAALNLSEHIGEKESAWGNESWRIAKPLEAQHA